MVSVIAMLVSIFALFAISRVFLRFKEGITSPAEVSSWTVFWITVTYVAWFPDVTFYFARFLGIERGIDVAVYISIIVLFYMMFRLYVKLDVLEQNTTKLARALSILNTRKKK